MEAFAGRAAGSGWRAHEMKKHAAATAWGKTSAVFIFV
jgi:hypothetical protein